jgi:hypothetical protein
MAYSMDNAGHIVPAHPVMANPVLASGQVLTVVAASTNYTFTVEAGASYRVAYANVTNTNAGDILHLGVTGTAVTAANKEWAIPLGQVGIVKIPVDKTTLNVAAETAGGKVYIAKLDNKSTGA